MSRMLKGKITGIGSYLPSHRLTNADLEKIVNTSDEWITSRTGIKERRIAGDDETLSDMAAGAGQKAMDMAGVKPEEIDLILGGTVTPDYRLPSAACVIQRKLGLVNAAAFDILAACAGFLHGLSMANAYIMAGQFKKIMVIGCEKLSSITDYTDRNTCVLFGDGAGAVIIEATDGDRGILSTFIKSDGRYGELLWIPDGGSKNPVRGLDNGHPDVYLKMNGSEVFKHAVRQMGDASLRVLKDAGLEPADVDLMVPHQANLRILNTTAKRLGIPIEKVFLNISKYGNTSAASVPIALDEAVRTNVVKENDIILMAAFGGGLTWGASLVRW